MKKNILFVSGLADNSIVEVVSAHLNGQIHYNYTGTCDFYNYITPSNWRKKLIFLDGRDISIALSPETHLIVNQIAEADTHTKSLARLQNILDLHPQIPVFNAPQHIALTRRDIVYNRLKDIKNLIAPKTIRFHPQSPQDILNAIQNENMHYPVILKAAGAHNGQHMVRLESKHDLDSLHAFALDGQAYYLIQYIDTAQQGIYTKHRLVMVRGQLFPRHLCALDHWMVEFTKANAFMTKHPQYNEQESDFIRHFNAEFSSQLAPIAQEIYKRIPIDFVGIDCCILPDGQLMIFEINANMLLLRSSPPKTAHLETIIKIKTAIYEVCQNDLKGAEV